MAIIGQVFSGEQEFAVLKSISEILHNFTACLTLIIFIGYISYHQEKKKQRVSFNQSLTLIMKLVLGEEENPN